MITGRCECGNVQYQVSAELVDYCHCHCSICRRIGGAPYVTWGGVARDKFSYLAGEQDIRIYSFTDRADSISCSNCSSTLAVDFKTEPDMFYITLGCVNGDVALPADGFHQFVESKAPWHVITDDLPQYGGWAVEPE